MKRRLDCESFKKRIEIDVERLVRLNDYINMSLDPKDVAALAIIAQSPQRHANAVENLRGAARQIGEAMVNPNRHHAERAGAAARDIQTWAQNNKTR